MSLSSANLIIIFDLRLPFSVQPAIVDDDGVIARLLVSSEDHHVRHLLEKVLADAELRVVVTVCVAPKSLPGEPAHGWSGGQAIVQSCPD